MTCVFAAVDILTQKVFKIDNIRLDIGLYIALYAIVFGTKYGIVTLRKRKKSNEEKTRNNRRRYVTVYIGFNKRYEQNLIGRRL